MPDITMCKGDHCPAKNNCYRFRAIPSERQSVFAELPFDDRLGVCDSFDDIKHYNKIYLRELEAGE